MKKTIVSLLTQVFIFQLCIYAEPDQKSAFKGMELYSFVIEDEIKYTLLSGTNRNKFPEEITSSPLTLKELIEVIKDLPTKEQIFWPIPKISEINFKYPDPDTMEKIESICNDRNIKLHINENL